MPYRLALNLTVAWLSMSFVTYAADAPDFNAQILPLFQKYCNTCHNANDAEAGLVLIDHPRTMKGSEDGAVVVAGKSDASRLWKRVIATDESRMPPKDQPLPKPEELLLIKAWIDGGAKAPIAKAAMAHLVTPRIPLAAKAREAIASVAVSRTGQMFAIARPHVVEVNQGSQTKRLEGHTGTINEVSFSPDGKWLCVAAGETGLTGEATLWHTSDLTRGPVIQGHRDGLYSAQVSPDGKSLATASYDRDVILWDLETLKPLQTFRGHNDAVYSLAFSPNGKFLATASGDRTVKLWDVSTGQRLDTFSQPAKEQSTVAFSPDGRFVTAGGVDCRVRVWQISESGQEGTNPILYARFAHEGPILRVAYSPDGRLLASSSEDRRIKIWDTTTYTQVAVLERQTDWPSAIAFSADNQQLIVGRMNGGYKSYPIDPSWTKSASALRPLDDSITSSISSTELAPQLKPLTEHEPNDSVTNANDVVVSSVLQGELKATNGQSTDVDYFRFSAKRGEQFIIETNASRNGSLADTKLDILTTDGQPVLRAYLQAVRDSWINFRPTDSSSPDVRLEFWQEMDLNQYLFMSGEVCKTFRAPQGPDSGYQLYSTGGKRRNYFDTSASAHAKDEPVYIVEAFAPTSKIVENGLPVFPLYFSNDDDGERKLGKDSRLTFTAPEDGTYVVRVADVRGFHGDKFNYTLTIRPPKPDFSLTVNSMNPKVPAGSGQRLRFGLNRIDGFDGEVRIDIAGMPKGFRASSPLIIQPGLLDTSSVLLAASDAPDPTKEDWERVTLLATATIDGQLVTKTVGGIGEIKLEKPAQVRVKLVPDNPQYTTKDQGLVIEPGTTITAKIVVERNGFEDDIKFDVDNLPHGIIVDNIGLSGVLVRKQEAERQIFLTARPWVPETDRLIHAVTQVAGNQASPEIRLSVRRKQQLTSQR